MGPDFKAIPGAEGWQLSNPSIFGMAPLKASLDIFYEAKMENLRAKSLLLTGYLDFLLGDKGGCDDAARKRRSAAVRFPSAPRARRFTKR